MPDHDLIGLHAEDLSASERADLARALASDPALAEEQAFADALALDVARLSSPRGGPSAAVIWRQATVAPDRARAWRLGAMGAGCLALAAGLLLVTRPPPVRDRGMADPLARPGDVHLELAAEGPGGLRPLGDGAQLGLDERLLARVQTSGAGQLVLVELRNGAWRRVSPPGWQVEPGLHTLGGVQPLAWRTEDGAGQARYLALLCAEAPALEGPLPPPGCASDALGLTWTE